jgi:hypothetical protein
MFFPSSAPGACGRCSCCTLLLLQHGDGRAREGSLLVEEDTHAARNATLPSLHWPTSRAPRPCWAFLAPTCQEEGRVSCTQPMSRRDRQAGGPLPSASGGSAASRASSVWTWSTRAWDRGGESATPREPAKPKPPASSPALRPPPLPFTTLLLPPPDSPSLLPGRCSSLSLCSPIRR